MHSRFFCVSDEPKSELALTLATAYNLRMSLLALLMIVVLNIFDIIIESVSWERAEHKRDTLNRYRDVVFGQNSMSPIKEKS